MNADLVKARKEPSREAAGACLGQVVAVIARTKEADDDALHSAIKVAAANMEDFQSRAHRERRAPLRCAL